MTAALLQPPPRMLNCRPLPDALRPLVDKFYRSHRSPMRSQAGDALWVAEHGADILAALSLRPMPEGHWLTGLFVAPQWRHQGLASVLVQQARQRHPEPIWLFCHPSLEGFYQRLGFAACNDLPPALHERLMRYQRNKMLMAMRAD